MKNLTFLVLITLILVSCRSPKPILTKSETTKTIKDSTYTTLTVVDTLQVLRPADTAKISRLLKELTSQPTLIKSNQATVSLRKVGDQIEATCVCDELKEAVKIYKQTIVTQTQIITEQKETITILQNQMNFFQKLFFWLGIGVGVLILGTVALRFIKPKFL